MKSFGSASREEPEVLEDRKKWPDQIWAS